MIRLSGLILPPCAAIGKPGPSSLGLLGAQVGDGSTFQARNVDFDFIRTQLGCLAQELPELPSLFDGLGGVVAVTPGVPIPLRRPAAGAVHSADRPAPNGGGSARLP